MWPAKFDIDKALRRIRGVFQEKLEESIQKALRTAR